MPVKKKFPFNALPEAGVPKEQIFSMARELYDHDSKNWRGDKRASGCVYIYDEELYKLNNEVSSLFTYTNPLHMDIWPCLAKFESEIVSMVGKLFNGGYGVFTSGGSDSIILTCKAHRKWAEMEKGITEPELILAESGHFAYLKACDILKIKPVMLRVDKNFQLRPEDVAKAVNKNTILIIASAPNYPYGVIDPIEALSELAVKHNIGLHVDACLGGLVLPFGAKLGYELPTFDFRNPGVTSISVDTHKYGFCCKGSSVILYRTKQLRDC